MAVTIEWIDHSQRFDTLDQAVAEYAADSFGFVMCFETADGADHADDCIIHTSADMRALVDEAAADAADERRSDKANRLAAAE